jgi:regulator of replication initiation timing
VENPTANAAAAAAPVAAPDPARMLDSDYVQQWQQETAKLRTQVRDLLDQETATQLEMNAASAQINAPITTQSAKDQAQRTLEGSQQRLLGIRAELSKVRSELQEKDLSGPPVKK